MSGERVLVSACLLGKRCRYDGGECRSSELERRLAEEGLVPQPFCPEEEGGLATPRPPAWIEGKDAAGVLSGRGRVVDGKGRDLSAAFLAGARSAVERCAEGDIRRAFLKEGSPSCGVAWTHVAASSSEGKKVAGMGVTAAALEEAGVRCFGV